MSDSGRESNRLDINSERASHGVVGWLYGVMGKALPRKMIAVALLSEKTGTWVAITLTPDEARATAARLNQFADEEEGITPPPPQRKPMIAVVGGPRDGDEVEAMGSEIYLAEPVAATWIGESEEKPSQSITHRYRINESGTKYIHMCCRAGEPGMNV